MLRKKAKPESLLEESIAEVHRQMGDLTADDPEYTKMVENLQKLYEIKDPKSKTRITFKDLLPIIGATVPVLMILTYESMGHTVTSKALSFVPKLKA